MSAVLVLGGGGAGLAAALSAREHGASSVLVIEAADQVGGTTAQSAGSFMAAGTSVQEAAGFPGDSPERLFDHLTTVSHWDIDHAVSRQLCHQAAPTLEWLIGHGVQFPVAGLYRAGREPFPRSHRAEGQGAGIVEPLLKACRERDVAIRTGIRAEKLLVEHGRVVGVEAGGERFTASATVLATGGFAHARDLVHRYIPDAAWQDGDAWSPAALTCRGDGLRMAEAVGASTADRGGGVVRLNPAFPVGDLYLPPTLLLVDDHGRRFVDESAPPAGFREVLRGRGGRCWAIFDEAGVRDWPSAVGGLTRGATTWARTLTDQIAAGRVTKADDVAGLGLPVEALRHTVAAYNEACAQGNDDAYGKSADHLRPVAEPPFYATELRPSVVLITGHGLEIDHIGRVLARDVVPIPGLYAAGEVTGNALGAKYAGQGIAITSCLVYGRLAGQAAADR
ncbi:hypothetical protein GCM10009555_061470 [Acrocarpospora macrocephala]|uniref:Flavocytochrome c n=1 Tax=Acrocarpospora macrocephala TaxID=150177 RepID=A0A5M3WM59_9ACTN|nr:FAD-dependent oxidoreductase [Acrocarpospora macrocephala]GES09590.1 flavocytochrome c [Acrocarpospora macrocephala]